MILHLPLILETRRNHALEHATLHVLARHHSGRMAGHSNPTGFFLLGDLSTSDVENAAAEALQRLRSGENELAIHPGCGTNMATSALLGAGLSWLVMGRAKSTLARILLLPVAVVFGVAGILLARPLGPRLQRHITTEAEMGGLQIVSVLPIRKGIHRIITR